MRRLEVWIVALVVLLSSVALAQSSPGTQKVTKGEVRFLAKITGGSFTATSEKVQGSVRLDPEKKTLTANITVPADSFRTGLALRDKHMRENYLEAKAHEEIVFSVDAQPIVLEAGKTTTLRGHLQVKGVRRPIEVEVRIDEPTDEGFKATTTFPVDVTEYGIAQPSFKVVKMDPVVRATVELVIQRAE